MKKQLLAYLALAVYAGFNPELSLLHAQGTAFSYQGQFNDGAGPANGTYALRFAVFDAPTAGNQAGLTLTNSAVNVTNGAFSVTLDFGAGVFTGVNRWLELGVRTNGGGAFTTLSPRQALTPVPYAILAGNLNGVLPDAQVPSTIARLNANQSFTGTANFNPAAGAPFLVGNTNRVTNLNADLVDGWSASGFWNVLGNSGTLGGSNFLGTADNQALDFRVNNLRAWRLEPNASSPNVVGGYGGNIASNGVAGAVIAGGGTLNNPNRVGGSYSTVGGGYNNAAYFGSATVAGGDNNTAAQDRSTVGGGYNNHATGLLSTVGGGDSNTAGGQSATVPGGSLNNAGASYALAAGLRAKATNQGAFVWADSQGTDFGSTAINQFLIRAQNGVGINLNNPAAALDVNGKARMTQFQLGSSSTIGQILTADASGNGSWQTPGFAARSGDTFTGGVTIANPGTLGFGTTTRQMLNLWGANYGIGVQNSTLYQRSDGGFAWFRQGTHNDNQNNPGTGGTNLMSLDSNGNLFANASVSVDLAGANNGSYYPGLVFGSGSGETISSQRGVAGPNRYGLDFYTSFNPRLSIANNGNVGINTTTPGSLLDINTGAGNLQVRNDSGLTAGLNLTGGGNAGVLRLRNSLEVWPSDDGQRTANVDVRDGSGNANIVLRGSGVATVKVLEITGGADVAEPFPLSQANLPKGSVMVIDEEHPGQLTPSDRPYDTRVAGILSGANGIQPGLTLHQNGKLGDGQNVALSGRVYVLADATEHPIKPGDLLTTAATPGHAMKVTDHGRAQGAVLGKAMTHLGEGKGLVLVLVSLQ